MISVLSFAEHSCLVVRSTRKREPEQSLEALNYLLSVETEEEVIEEAQKAIYLLTSKKGSRSTE